MGSGICGAALLRAADAMLTALGGEQVSLLLPATATASDAAGQLGLVDPGVQEVIISPVVAQELADREIGAAAENRVHAAGFGDCGCNCPSSGWARRRNCSMRRWG